MESAEDAEFLHQYLFKIGSLRRLSEQGPPFRIVYLPPVAGWRPHCCGAASRIVLGADEVDENEVGSGWGANAPPFRGDAVDIEQAAEFAVLRDMLFEVDMRVDMTGAVDEADHLEGRTLELVWDHYLVRNRIQLEGSAIDRGFDPLGRSGKRAALDAGCETDEAKCNMGLRQRLHLFEKFFETSSIRHLYF